MVRSLLESVLARAQIPENTNTIALVNLTPYDGMVERATRKWKEISVDSPFHFKTLSLTKNLGICEFVEKALALELMEDRGSIPQRAKLD